MNDGVLAGCGLVSLVARGDDRGRLVAIEAEREVPFEIARVYYIYATQPGIDRGFHAHRTLSQLAVAVAGGCTIVLDDGRKRVSVRLDEPTTGLTVPPMVWHELTDFSTDCVLMVLADAIYDETDYIRDYAAFRELAER